MNHCAPFEPHYTDGSITLFAGDCLDVLATLPDASVDAVVTDPPYGLEFMGKDWDRPQQMGKLSRIGKPDGTPFRRGLGTPAWGAAGNPSCLNCRGTKYDSGPARCRCTAPNFPNHMAAQMRAFEEWCEAWATECLRVLKPGGHMLAFGGTRTWHRLACAIEDAGFEVRDAIAWMYGSGFPKSLNLVGEDGERTGWGTALKPAHEPIVVARKPLAGTVAGNVKAHGTGALNIDGCRTDLDANFNPTRMQRQSAPTAGMSGLGESGYAADHQQPTYNPAGRWPANVILDESQAEALDEQSGDRPAGGKVTGNQSSRTGESGIYGTYGAVENSPYDDHGGASRFFYVAKADSSERVRLNGVAHPTVKPLSLMRWLVRLVTPPGGTVLEPFAGSGTTVEACLLEEFKCIAIEREADYLPLIKQRIHRRRDPVAAINAIGDDAGLFGLLDGGVA